MVEKLTRFSLPHDKLLTSSNYNPLAKKNQGADVGA